jgi:hypothetical protein
MQYCISYTGNTCSKITYKHDSVSATCPCGGGGTACTDAYYVAYTDCQDAAGACAELDSCCDTIDTNYEPSCRSYVSTYQGQNHGDVSCKSILSSWQSSGLCP